MSAEFISVAMGIRYSRDDTSLLERSINSILAQSYTKFEFLICEKDSTIAAKKYLKEIARKDTRIKLIDGEKTSSFSEQLNMCLKAAKGDFIARMDDDDFSAPERFERQLEYLKHHDKIAFVGSNVKLFQDGKVIGTRTFPEFPKTKDFLFNMPFVHPSLMFRKSALQAVEGYSELPRCERCEDYDLLLRMYEKGIYGANLQQELFTYSLPPNGITTRNFHDRLNESKTRFARFAALGLMPRALPYAIKPLIVWAVPKRILAIIKEKTM